MYWLFTAPDGQLRNSCSAPSQNGFGWLPGMNRSTEACGPTARPWVVNALPAMDMYPCPSIPSAPQPWVSGDVTSDRTAWLEVQRPTSSKPNSRASDDWFAHACVCGVAGMALTSALMVKSPPFGPTPEITTPPLRRRDPGDRSMCHGLLFRTVNEPP